MDIFINSKKCGAGVTPVKSGVTPDFGRAENFFCMEALRAMAAPRFGRDARNHRPEARFHHNYFSIFAFSA
jgi:hypothetical protein